MNLEGIRILLVEDNPADVRLLLELVRETGAGRVKLEHVRRLDSALEFLGRETCDVILLDLSLPDMQGLETVARVHARAPNVPIVVLTGLDDEALAVRALRTGAQDYLVKGRVDGDLLIRSLRYASERGRAIEALERREEHYRSLIENSLDLVSILNADGTIRYASPSHERQLGYRLDELVGQNAFAFLHPEDIPAVRSAFTRAEGAASVQCRFRHKDGSWRVIEASGRDLSHLPGVRGVVVNSRDVTERRRLEDQLHHSQRLEAIGRLAGGVAHDFNNLLMVITGHAQMLLDAIHPADPSRADLEQVVKAAERATDLTRQLLAFGRRQVVRPRLLNLNALVQDMDRMLRRVIGADVELVTVLASGLETVRADAGQLEQVVLNLAVNARDAMPRGGRLTLETSNVGVTEELAQLQLAPEPGRYVMLSISDTGSGMDSEVLSRVFEPFFTTKEHGSGLGLSTSYGIIRQTGGNIWVDSKPGAGTTFRIYLPVSESAAEQPEAPAPNPEMRGTETILLVEDEEGVRHVVETMLRRRGYHVLSSASSSEAVQVAEQHPGSIHLLITDIIMPGASGRNMADHLVARRPEMRVLYVSGYGDPAGPAAQNAFLQKPFSIEELAVKVREVLREA
ncbi:MAG TPA: response regulator [Bryobacteraceae bacterium]|nr:response regulator [Bryobacteraceae bacterium]